MKTSKLGGIFFGVAFALAFLCLSYYYYRPPLKNYVNDGNNFAVFHDLTPCANGQRPQVYVSGEPFGIKLLSDGVMVVDLQKGDCAAKKCGIKAGDIILCANGCKVDSNAEISDIIKNCDGQTIEFEIRRNGEIKTVKVTPDVCDGSYRAGMWVRDSSAGIGTLTFFTKDGTFGGLGHPVCDIDTNKIIPIKDGKVADVVISDFKKSKNGSPGALLGGFTPKGDVGEIYLNEQNGVFGKIKTENFTENLMELGYKNEVKTGKAQILTTVDGKTPQLYEIQIKEIKHGDSSSKNMVIQVTDKELIAKTGGILQGMSGSPIIQNGRLVGAVTHVFVNDVTMGYGVFAQSMYETATSDKNAFGLLELSA